MGEALIRSSSAMAVANNTMEETIALATAMNESLQSPEKVGTVASYNSEQEIAARNMNHIRNGLSALWSSEDFKSTRDKVMDFAKAVGGITVDNVRTLAGESEELSAILNQTGMDAKFLAMILQTTADGGNGFDLITADALRLNEALIGASREFENVTAARARFDSAMSVAEKDTDFRAYADAFSKLNEQFEAGTVNSNAFWAAAEFLFGSDQLNAWGWSEGLDDIYEAMQRIKPVLEDADSAGAGFIEELYRLSEAGELLDAVGDPLLEIAKLADGQYTFDIDPSNLDAIAKKMGIAEEAALSCLKALSMWGNVDFYDIDEVFQAVQDNGLSAITFDGTAINVSALTDQLMSLGRNNEEIHKIVKELQALEGVVLIDPAQSVESLTSSLVDLGLAADDGVTLSVNYQDLANLLSEMNFTKEQAQELITKLGEVDNITLKNAAGEAGDVAGALEYIETLDFATVQENINGVAGAVEELDGESTDNVTSELYGIGSAADTATSKIEQVRKVLQKLDGTVSNVVIDVQRKGSILGALIPGFASGTDSAPGGESLVGEEGAELVQSGSRAYLVGTNGPEIVDLNRGDRVFPADETKKIVSSKRHISGVIPAYKEGVGTSNGAYKGTINTTQNKAGAYGTTAATANVNVGVSVDSSSLEEQLEDTLKELEKRISEIIGDFEHDIFLLERNGGTAEQIADVYRKMQEAIHAQAEEYRALGLDENSDYIQKLQQDWWKYYDNLSKLREDEFADSISDRKFAIDILERDDTDASIILLSWRDILKKINAEIDYYTSMGYDTTSDVIQDLMKELWSAEEAMLAVLDNVIDKTQDSIDSLQNVYKTLMAAADEYADSGYVTLDTLQSIVDLERAREELKKLSDKVSLVLDIELK